MNQTAIKEIIAMTLPNVIVNCSTASDGLMNIRTLSMCQRDSVHVEYFPDFI